jgi:hypothetical protein
MLPLDFRHVRTRTCIGPNDLPCGPRPPGPTAPLEAQRGFRQRHPRRGSLEPAGLQGLEEGQAPYAQRHTGPMHNAQAGQRRRTLRVPQPAIWFQVADGQLERTSRPLELDALEGRPRQVCAHQEDGLLGSLQYHAPDLVGDLAQPHVPPHEDPLGQLAIQGAALPGGGAAGNRLAHGHGRP